MHVPMSHPLLSLLYERAQARPGTVAHAWPGSAQELAAAFGVTLNEAYEIGLRPAPTVQTRAAWAREIATLYRCGIRRAQAASRRLCS